MTPNQLLDQFVKGATTDAKQAAIDLAKALGEMWWFRLIEQGDKLQADIAGIVLALNNRWQAAVGMPLEEAERLAGSEK